MTAPPDVLAGWDDLHDVQPMGGGHRDEVWAVTVDGRPAVARRSTRAPAALDWELDLMGRAAGAGVGVPVVRPASSGRLAVAGWTVMEVVAGDPPSRPADWVAVAGALAALHRATEGGSQRPGFVSTHDLLETERGGDVDLVTMPDEAVTACRAAWRALPAREPTAIHGDPGADNIVMRGGQPVLLDWDEARVDHPWLDLASLPNEASPLTADQRRIAAAALNAWEAAACWNQEPTYARRRLARLLRG